MRHGYQLGLLAEQAPILIQNQLAVVIDGNHPQSRTDLFTEHLPWNNIGVVFHRRDDDLISHLEEGSPITLRNQVNRFGGTANEDTFLFAPVDEETLYLPARRFIICGCPLTQVVDTTMNIRILGAVIAIQRVDNTLWFLTGGPVVEVHQGLAMDLLLQNR